MPTSKEEILALDDLPTVVVTVPEWDDREVTIRTWTGMELARFLDGKPGDVFLDAAALSLVDDAGKRMFTTPADLAALRGKNGSALKRIAEAAFELNKVSEAAVEETAGN